MEVFFHQPKSRLAFDRYQIRSAKGLHRYWLLMSLAHLISCTSCGETMYFEDRYAFINSYIQEERIRYIYQYGARHVPFEELLVCFGCLGLLCNFLNLVGRRTPYRVRPFRTRGAAFPHRAPRDMFAQVISAKYFSISAYGFLQPIFLLLMLHSFVVKLYLSLCTSFCFSM